MAQTTLDGSATPFQIAAGATEQANNGDTLALLGAIENQGTILVNGTGPESQSTPSSSALANIVLASATVTLVGGGTLRLTQLGVSALYATAAGATLVNADNTITGAGDLGVAYPVTFTDGVSAYPIGIVNLAGGVIDASESPAGGLFVNPLFLSTGSAGLINAGLLEATGTSGLFLRSGRVVNTGGTVVATGSARVVEMFADTVTGGVLDAAAGGTINVSSYSGEDATLQGVTLESSAGGLVKIAAAILDGTAADNVITAGSTIEVTTSGTLQLTGTIRDSGMILLTAVNGRGVLDLTGGIDNLGTIQVSSPDNFASIQLGTPVVTLTGGGAVVLTPGGGVAIAPSGSAPATLVNVDNIISGAGQIGQRASSPVGLTNDAAGVIDATGAAGAGLSLYGGAGAWRNAGLIKATGAGGLQIAVATLDNTGGTLLASGAGAVLSLQSIDVIGGSIQSGAGGIVAFTGGANTLESGAGPLSLSAGTTLKVGNASLALAGAAVTIDGGGTLLLEGGTLDGSSGGSVFNSATIVADAFQGGSFNDAASGVRLTNLAAGVIDGVDLEFARSTMRNAGLLEGALSVGLTSAATTTIDNTGGTILANATVATLYDADIIGGTLAGSGGGTIAIGRLDAPARLVTLDGRTGAVTLAAGAIVQTFYTEISLPFTLEVGATVDLLGTIHDMGGTLSQSFDQFSGGVTTNSGLFYGSGAITGAITNDGTLRAEGGTLSVIRVDGVGSIEIGAGATLALGTVSVNPVAATGQTVDFGGERANLVLNAPTAYTGTLANMVAGDSIDLVGASIAAAQVTGGNTLAVAMADGSTLDYELAHLQAGASFDIVSATATPTRTYTFTYTGGSTTAQPDYSATGAGTFTVDTGAGSATLGAVTAFRLDLHVVNSGTAGSLGAGADDFSYGLSNLSAFTASFGAGGALTGLALATANLSPGFHGAQHTFDQSFNVSGLGAGGAVTEDFRSTADTAGAVAITGSTEQFSELVVACFAAGTRIRTARGEVPVEALRVGDRAATASGDERPVVWTGHRRIDCRRHPAPHDVQPIRVAAHAFAPGAPRIDLMLSPDHAVLVGGVLIPVRYLVNGATIARLRVAFVTYWHVELDAHDVVLAEGLACESYLDTGNRGAFIEADGAVKLHADFARSVWAAGGCAPLHLAGPEVQAARERLLGRALAQGYRLANAAALCLETNGRRIAPTQADARRHCFALPPDAALVRLISAAGIPAETSATGTDHRRLGVAVAEILLDGRVIGLDDARLGGGWHHGEGTWRWTDGSAWIDCAGVGQIELTVVMAARCWVRPARGAIRSGRQRA